MSNQKIEDFKVGHLTALHNSNRPMTVSRVDIPSKHVHTQHFVDVDLIEASWPHEQLVGSGEELVFKGGVFIKAQ